MINVIEDYFVMIISIIIVMVVMVMRKACKVNGSNTGRDIIPGLNVPNVTPYRIIHQIIVLNAVLII